MRYGALAQLPDGRQERFLPGAFGPDISLQDVILNSMHLAAVPPGTFGRGRFTAA